MSDDLQPIVSQLQTQTIPINFTVPFSPGSPKPPAPPSPMRSHTTDFREIHTRNPYHNGPTTIGFNRVANPNNPFLSPLMESQASTSNFGSPIINSQGFEANSTGGSFAQHGMTSPIVTNPFATPNVNSEPTFF